MKPTIAEVRRLRARVAELERLIEDQRNRWANNYPGGTHIASVIGVPERATSAIKTARALNHAVVAVQIGTSEIAFYALPHPKVSP